MNTEELSEEEDAKIIPPTLYGHCGCVVGDYLYIFGGHVRKKQRMARRSRMFRFDLRSFQWSEIPVPAFAAVERHMGSMVHDRGVIWIVGGSPRQQHDVICFHIGRQEWRAPSFSGVELPPLRAHSAVAHNRHIYVFGGSSPASQGGADRDIWYSQSDLFVLSLDDMHWRKLEAPGVPRMRYHAAVMMGDVMYLVSNDAMWTFNCRTEAWDKVQVGCRMRLCSGCVSAPRRIVGRV